MTVVLGIDPGSRVSGYGVIEVNGSKQVYLASGCIRTDTKASLAHKLEEIFSGINEIISQYNPSEFAIEKIFMARSAESALKLGHARGVAMLAGVTHGLTVSEYEARKVKQAVVGTGAATKDQVQHMVKILLNLSGKIQVDTSDALAVALSHAHNGAYNAKIAKALGR